MCQLTYINTNNKFLNQLWTINQALINTWTEHKDGWGIYTNKIIYKDHKEPWSYYNFGGQFCKLITNSPVILHVRKASFTGAAKIVDNEHTHPFETENLVLAHNGTLDSSLDLEFKMKDKIDSQIFLSELDKKYTQNNDLVVSLQETMKEFTGKFAFLIYEKSTDKFYAVRGESATLFHYPVSLSDKDEKELSSGYIINTERPSLINSIYLISNTLSVNKLKISVTDSTNLLKDNSIYLLGDTIELVGEIKENKKVYSQVQIWNEGERNWESWSGYGGVQKRANLLPEKTVKVGTKEEINVDKIVDYCINWNVSVWYIDTICFCLFGKSMVALNESSFDRFIKILDELDKISREKHLLKGTWTVFKRKAITDFTIHTEYPHLQFPYFLWNLDELESAYLEYKNSIKES